MHDNYILVIFNFETGEPSCPFWQVFAVVNRNQFDRYVLEDAIMSYFDSGACEDKDFEDSVKDILNSFGWDWKKFDDPNKILPLRLSEEVAVFWI